MINQESLIILDVAMIILMLVLASLSKRLGEAMKIPPVYHAWTVGVVFILIAAALSGIDTIANDTTVPLMTMTAISLRVAAGALSVVASLRYWHWLFSEYFKI